MCNKTQYKVDEQNTYLTHIIQYISKLIKQGSLKSFHLPNKLYTDQTYLILVVSKKTAISSQGDK